MNAVQVKTAKVAGAVVGGGLVLGALVALSVPTTMKPAGENWRQLIGIHEAPNDSSSLIAFEAPPEDLAPVRWETAGQEYPASTVPQDNWLEPASYQDFQPAEELPQQPIDSRDLDDNPAVFDISDDAASSARAASEAAAEVRAMETVADAPDGAQAAPPAAPAQPGAVS